MERISWTEKINNAAVLRRVGEKRSMMTEVTEGKMEGKRGPGRKENVQI